MAQHLETTVSKVNVTVDDINYKMDKLNEPINVVSGIFNKEIKHRYIRNGIRLEKYLEEKIGGIIMKFGKVLFGVGLGVLAGLLFAPKKGSELREDIKAKSKSTYDYLASLTREDVEAKLGETIENIKKSVDEFDPDDFKETTKEKVDEVQKKLEILAEKVKSSEKFDKVKGSVVEVTGRVNQKIDEVKTMINDKAAMIDEDVIDQQIDDVEKQLDEMIEEIKD